MGRGLALRTKIKREILATKSVAVAMLEAERLIQQRKPLKQSIEEHIGRFIDKLDANAAIKLGTIAGLAYIIKPLIDMHEEIQAKLSLAKALYKGADKLFFKGIPIMQAIDVLAPMAAWLASIAAPTPEKLKEDLEQTDWQTWILAFVIAALIIQFGPDIIKSFGSIGALGLALVA